MSTSCSNPQATDFSANVKYCTPMQRPRRISSLVIVKPGQLPGRNTGIHYSTKSQSQGLYSSLQPTHTKHDLLSRVPGETIPYTTDTPSPDFTLRQQYS